MTYYRTGRIPGFGAELLTAEDKSIIQNMTGVQSVLDRAKVKKEYQDKAYAYFYDQQSRFLEEINKNEVVKKITQIGDATYALGSGVGGVVSAAQGIADKGKIDAAGIVSIAQASSNLFEIAGKFASAIGASDATAREIVGWGRLATGCVGGIAQNTILGAVACGCQFIMKMLDAFFTGTNADYGKLEGRPRYAFSPSSEASSLIHVDMLRLASVLKYIYGVPNMIGFHNKFSNLFPDVDNSSVWENASLVNGSLQLPQYQKIIPAITPKMLLHAMDFDNNSNIDLVCAMMATIRFPYESKALRGGYVDMLHRIYDQHDISPTFFEAAASVGRYMVNWKGTTSPYYGLDLWPAIRVSELINFFVGVTLKEMDEYDARIIKSPPGVQYLADKSPVPMLRSDDGDNWYYDRRFWTSFSRHGVDGDDSQDAVQRLGERVAARDMGALKEFAFIRLLSAFSQMYAYFRWTTGRESLGERSSTIDAISKLPSYPKGSIDWLMNAPVDPRQVTEINGQMVNIETADFQIVEDPYTISQRAMGAVPVVIQGAYVSPTGNDARESKFAPTLPNGKGIMPQLFQVVFNGAGVPQGGNLPPDSIRDGKILKSFIKNREDTLSDVMIKAKRDSEIAGRFKGYQTATDIKSQFKQSMVKQNIISSSGGALAAIKSGKIAVTLTKDMPQKLMDQCASEGGVATLVISGKDGKQKVMCIPSAEAMARLKSECFQKGMVPVWVDNETQFSIMRQMECNKKGSMLPISILAATGIALFLTMR